MSHEWHAVESKDAMHTLKTDLKGLNKEEAKRRLEEFGPNELRKMKGVPWWKILLSQFKNILIIILLIATGLAVWMGEIVDALVIVAIVIACATIGFSQEYRGEKSLEALKRLAAPQARVIRNGQDIEVPSKELVPGDIVVLRVGDIAPADIRLVEAWNLQTNEASLTGESTPVSKDAKTVMGKETLVSDRRNMIFSATTVTYGRGKGVVAETGMNTEFGKIAGEIQVAEQPPTPLETKLAHVGKWIGIICVVVCAAVAGVNMIRGLEPLKMVLWGTSLAVAAVPEALPAVITGGFAIGMRMMAKRNAIVRKLPVVGTIGCSTVICADKTGTYTRNEMTTRKIFVNGEMIDVSGEGFIPKGQFSMENNVMNPKEDEHLALLLKIGALTNDAKLVHTANWKIIGDPTEGALLVSAYKAGMKKDELEELYPRIGEVPFTSERKRMSTIHRTPEGKNVAYVKGAPEVVLKLCKRVYRDSRIAKLSREEENRILKLNEKMASEGLRVLSMAYRELPENLEEYTEKTVENDIIFVGLQGMIDPARIEAIEAVESCKRAGIRSVMITGDHKLTAMAVARELGISGKALTGDEMDKMSDEEFKKAVDDVSVYARVSPHHKMRIIRALQDKGEITVMTGDGINDAPAIKSADVGVAMGITGTEVTKEASDMVLADDNFASIVAAVKEGRGSYDNIAKYLMYLLSCNIAEILIMFVAGLVWTGGWSIPLLTAQILWVNLLTDGLPAMALGVDPPTSDVMNRPPRDPRKSIFAEMKVYLVYLTIILTVGVLFVYSWAFTGGLGVDKARSMALATLIAFELFVCFECRSLKHSLFEIGIFSNKWLIIAVVPQFVLLFVVISVPFFNPLMSTVPLTLTEYAISIGVAFTVIPAIELFKLVNARGRRTFPCWPHASPPQRSLSA